MLLKWSFEPERVPCAKLDLDYPSSEVVMDALSKGDIVSVTDVPGFREAKKSVVIHLHTCLIDQEADGEANNYIHSFAKNVLTDGTVRRTMASITIPGPGGAQPFIDRNSQLPSSCEYLSKNLESFRRMVDEVTEVFSERLSSEMGTSLKSPLMYTEDGSFSFDELKDVVR